MELTANRSIKMPLFALCLGFFMVVIDVNIVNVALPSLAKSLGGGISWLQWVIDGYALTFACLMLSAGSLGDQLGAKPAYLSGLSLFVFASLACGLAYSFLCLTFFRLLQGVGAAFLVPTSLALINSSYTDKESRAKAIGIWASVGGIAAASGPVIGAILTAWLGWRSIFYINIPIGILGIFLTVKYIPSAASRIKEKISFDFFGQIAGIISIASLAFSLIEMGRLGWHSFAVMSSFSIFIAALVVFLLIEYYSSAPMFPLKFFKSGAFSASIFVGVIINLGFYGILFTLPLYFQEIRGYSTVMIGLAITPLTALAAICSYFSGKLVSVSGSKNVVIAGLLIGVLGFFSLYLMGGEVPYYILMLPMLLIGAGGSMTVPAVTVAVINAVPEGRAGIAAGAFNTARQIGSLVGVAVSGTILNLANHFMAGMHNVLLMSGIIFILGFIATLKWID